MLFPSAKQTKMFFFFLLSYMVEDKHPYVVQSAVTRICFQCTESFDHEQIQLREMGSINRTAHYCRWERKCIIFCEYISKHIHHNIINKSWQRVEGIYKTSQVTAVNKSAASRRAWQVKLPRLRFFLHLKCQPDTQRTSLTLAWPCRAVWGRSFAEEIQNVKRE